MVSGLFGKASMLLPFVRFICVLFGFSAVSLGSFWVRVAILCMMRFVWRQDGPTMPIAMLGWVTAYHRSRAEMMNVLPLCRHHLAAVNWFSWKSLMNCS